MRDLSAVFVLGVDSLVSAFRQRKALRDGGPSRSKVLSLARRQRRCCSAVGRDRTRSRTLAGVRAGRGAVAWRPAGWAQSGQGHQFGYRQGSGRCQIAQCPIRGAGSRPSFVASRLRRVGLGQGMPLAAHLAGGSHCVAPVFHGSDRRGQRNSLAGHAGVLIEKKVIADPGLCLLAWEGTSRGVAILTPPPPRKAARR